MLKEHSIIEYEEGGLITKAEIVLDMGDKWNLKVLEHHTPTENGTFRTVKKNALKIYEIIQV